MIVAFGRAAPVSPPGSRGDGGRKMRMARWPALAALALLIALAAVAGAGMWFYLAPAPPAAAQTTVDYDLDNDGLIEVNSLDQLNAVRWDLDGNGDPASANTSSYAAAFPFAVTSTRMGCPAGGCTGYELDADLDFDTDGNRMVTSDDAYPDWTPIDGYRAVFDGNGHTITRLTITDGRQFTGLFGSLQGSAVVRYLGIVDASVSGRGGLGGVGVLTGEITASSTVIASYAAGGTVAATRGDASVGGLVGINRGVIRASYATVVVSANRNRVQIGGLVGTNAAGTIIASYAAGAVAGSGNNTNVGGFVGRISNIVSSDGNTLSELTNNYCDSDVHATTTPCIGGTINLAGRSYTVAAQTTSNLQTPVGYTGIYANWNIDLDGDNSADNPWNFGAAGDYPILNPPGQIDYDSDNDGLIEIGNLDQLNAVRWDLDGNGAAASGADANSYARAFRGGDTAAGSRMGCPAGACTGYELAADLDFDADGDGMVTSTDPYPLWPPIGLGFTATFEGNGHTISNLTITDAGWSGLFRQISNGGEIRNLGMLSPNVSTGGNHSGVLAGVIENGAEVNASYVSGGSISIYRSSGRGAGGLAGTNRGTIRASYSTATVDGGPHSYSTVGGLVARLDGGAIIASYAAGAVSAAAATAVVGGFAGSSSGTSTVITNSYCDSEVQATTTPCIGSQSGASVTAEAKTTAELHAPQGYTGIYAQWDVSIDGDTVGDNVWRFGSARQYPTLFTPAQRMMTFTDYDTDKDGLREISTLAQLNAIRWDLDGDGAPATATAAYNAAFGGRDTVIRGMLGYELTADLDFDTSRNGSVGAEDDYPNWDSIGNQPTPYAGVFDGNGRILRRLTITGSSKDTGLFSVLSASSTVRDLVLADASVTGGASRGLGILVGRNFGRVTTSYLQGGTVTASGNFSSAGGLVGINNGNVYASWSTARVVGGGYSNTQVGGLVGTNSGNGPGRVFASYAAGQVSGSGGGTSFQGGLVGRQTGSASVANGYCDTTVNATLSCVGNAAGAAEGKSTTELRTPTKYTGIYANWNIDLDGDTFPDNPWNFRAANQYPTPNTSTQRAAVTDYDSDNDNLIDVDSLDQLNAIRYDLNGDGLPGAAGEYVAYAGAFPGGDLTATSTRMGCAATCEGYELTANLNFDADGVGGVTSTDPYPNWTPIGGSYSGVFDGNGRTIRNLTISNATGNAGLFNILANRGVIRDVGIIDPNVSGGGVYVGALAALIDSGGEITASYVQGGSIAPVQTNTGGGLVGGNSGTIRASYSTASVSGGTSTNVGGLVGNSSGVIIASYAAGAVTGVANSNVGGLLGRAAGSSIVITDSYCDTTVHGTSTCIGFQTGGATATSTGYTTAELQTPTGYTGIYAQWNIDLDGDTFVDNPWNFGASGQYPVLNTPGQRAIDYDSDNDGLIEISDLDQLNAVRWDLDGNGVATSTATTSYFRAFPSHNRTAGGRMGCPSGNCAGYELAADLDFAADGIAVTSTDSYPNWTPIGGAYASVFDGNGHTIRNLTISSGTVNGGLFNILGGGGAIRDVGMIDAQVNSSAAFLGVLAGQIQANGVVSASYAAGGSLAGGSLYMGGLIGRNDGTIRAGYATVAVNGGTVTNIRVGGLAGHNNDGDIIASYAAGSVSATGVGANVGGLAGQVNGSGSVITNSYCDTSVQTTTTPCVGSETGGASVTAEGKTTAELQSPTGYAGIYAQWDISIDGDNTGDHPWGFGSTRQYPLLYTPAQRAMYPFTDYDTDSDGLTEVDSLAKLNAIRWDLDGDGSPETGAAAYNAAFAGRDPTIMGRLGYELTQDLDFDTDGSGSVGAGDEYPNWTPIGSVYRGVFDGNGRTISNMTITSSGVAGLFSILGANAALRDLGMLDAVVGGSGVMMGVLAGSSSGEIIASYAAGGSVVSTAGLYLGGLVGQNVGTIRAGYARVSVDGGAVAGVKVGGLVGFNDGAAIIASYAAGRVTGTAANADVGGLAGQVNDAGSVITGSYCDTSAQTAATPCVGNETGGASVTVEGQTAAELQAPTGYTGIYARWNLSLDGDDFPDNPWRFATSTGQYPALNTPMQRAVVADYDRDDDGLIDVASVYQLNAIRHDLNGDGLPDATSTYVAYAGAFPGGDLAATGTRMGCATGCAGYELTADLDFAADGMAVTSTDAFPNWDPIGGSYDSTFDGDGHTISNMTINTSGFAGLFNVLGADGVIRDLGMIDADVSGSGWMMGVLVGNSSGEITASYAAGGSVASSAGLYLGGLVGRNGGTIRASYARVAVDGGTYGGVAVGGLAGFNNGAAIIASYAAGAVSGAGANADVGGLAGLVQGSGSAITDSYCDTSVHSTTTPCIGEVSGGANAAAAGYTAAQLQRPIGYSGIYANWNIDLDGDSAADNPWRFGGRTDYPRLIDPDSRTGLDYDGDDDGLIDVSTLLQLNAIRYDLDGDGMIATSSAVAYGNAFPGRDTATSTFMGCRAGTCAGYELAADLDFDTDGSGGVTATDEYPNWAPIGPYTSVFDGDGRTITRLTITGATSSAGLFGVLSSGGVIRDLGMVGASVSGGAAMAGFGALVGENHGRITASYVRDGAVTLTAADANAGGLVGINTGAGAEIRAAYSTATVDAGAQTGANAGGLVGLHRGGGITASYAAGMVSGGVVTGTSTTGTSAAGIGGFAGRVSGTSTAITDGYCDTDVVGASTPCVGVQDGGAGVTVEGKTTAELQSPTGYTGIYEDWNIGLAPGDTDDYPWNFGTSSEYPVLHTPAQREAFVPPEPVDPGSGDRVDPVDPVGPGPVDPGATPEPEPPAPSGVVVLEVEELEAYDAAAGHPEVYGEEEFEASVTCKTFGEDPDTGGPTGSILAFDLGSYTGDFVLTLSLWDGKRFITYEGQDIDLPEPERFGQVVELWVVTDPANTRFRLDIRRYGLVANLLLGYADCREDG